MTARVQQMVPETYYVYRRRPRVEACGTCKYHEKKNVATRNASPPTRTHTLSNEDAQRKDGTTRSLGSMDHVSVLG